MNNKIAIIGSSGLFPGSSTLEEFWQNLEREKDLTSLSTAEDFGADPAIFFNPDKGVVDKCYALRGGYIRDFNFDPNGYKLAPEFLAKQDKLYQWSLYVAKEALKDSGYLDNEKVKAACGLILGNLSFPTSSSHKLLSSVYTKVMEEQVNDILDKDDFKIKAHHGEKPDSKVLEYLPSEMVSKALGLKGGHFALDAACATSLYAIKLACDELLTGKTDLMLAGAVCASDQLFIHMGFSIFHAYAPAHEKFVPLDKNSAGLVSSEGAGMVVLKRLADAERDGDNILAVVGGIGLSNDGKGKFLLSPNPKGQRLAFERAYKQYKNLPQDTSYLECHATGTPLGDVTEMNSISDFFEQYNTKPLLGSVKSNMGHLLTAAGMTGLLKVLLAMQKNVIPPNINLEEPVEASNGFIGLDQMITKNTPWSDSFKQAGINSFGFGGTNAHMIVQNYQVEKTSATQKDIPLKSLSILGMDAHFGNCSSLQSFYESIYFGKQHFIDLPSARWKGMEASKSLLKSFGFESGKAPKGAYISDFEIDLFRYKIQPKEAETLEPQQALILKVADQAIKDAGLQEGQNVAVLVAMESELAIHHYLARWDVSWQIKESLKAQNIELDEAQIEALENICKDGVYFREGAQTPSQHTSFVGNIMASRIAALWDFTGPAFTVSCGENSVFKALEIAQNLLSLGEVDAVVLGGVDFSGGLENVLLRNQKERVNQNADPSISYNDKDSGWLIGEGAGAIVLKASDTTIEKVYAVIDELTESKLLEDSTYVELAATGFQKVDILEESYLLSQRPDHQIALGSVQSNIGNTFAASGIAAIIKTALSLKHKFIPPVPNWEKPVVGSIFHQSPYYFPAAARPWILPSLIDDRKATVLGLDSKQVRLREVKVDKLEDPKGQFAWAPAIFLLKGLDEVDLLQQLAALEIAIETEHSIAVLSKQFYTSFKAKKGKYTIVLVAKEKTGLEKEIKFYKSQLYTSFKSGKELRTPSGSYFTPTPLGKDAEIVFVYPGSATVYPEIGRDLFQYFPELLTEFEKLYPHLDEFIWTDYLFPKKRSISEASPDVYQNAIAMMSSGVFYSAVFTNLLRDKLKLNPSKVMGYSMGECSSMWYAMKVWDVKGKDEFQKSPIFKNRFAGNLELLASYWGVSSEEAKSKWVSINLLAPLEKIKSLVEEHKEVYLSFINTSNNVVISGDKVACLAIAEKLKCSFIEIPFQNVIHHHFCEQEKEGLLSMHDFELIEQPNVDFYSSITKQKIPFDSKTIAENSTDVCLRHVDLPGTVEALYKEGGRIFVEVGANNTCTSWIKEILKDKEAHAVAVDQKSKLGLTGVLNLIAELSSHGVELDLDCLFQSEVLIKKGTSFLKKIVPGGKRSFGQDLSKEQKEIFSKIKKPAKEMALVAGDENQRSDAFELLENKKKFFIPKAISANGSQEKHKPTMDTVTKDKPKKWAIERIGENGLKLYDFDSGEQLEGKDIIFTQEDLVEFANGKIANVFGDAYKVIDTYSRRVMLPMDPYLLVSRVTGLKGKMGVYEPSTMQTEYDIPYDAWFTTDRQIPWAVSVESGQCDLMLISYLGIDFQNKGNLVYRLLDCTLTFVDDLPFEGQTLRYDISINSFVRNGENLLFFFSYRCYVQDRLVLKMDGGCAGFFADDQLEEGAGVVYSDGEKKVRLEAKKRYFTPLLNTEKTSFSKDDLRYLINGDMEKCFEHESYFANGRNPSLRLPPEKILMLDRIVSVDLTGGAYGLGMIIAEKDLKPEDWYFPCHFRDDEVLAGSLQAEGGGNLLRFFMLMLGLQRLTKDARYQPVFDLPQKVRCRKQVTPHKDTKLVYKLEIKEIGLVPNPYVIGDLEIISDGVVTVHFENLGLQLREKDNPKYLEKQAGVHIPARSEGSLLNEEHITTFALDDLSKCFGEDFAVYDGRKVSRQPNTDLQLISRVLKIEGERGDFSKPSTIYAEYDVPQDAWYYKQNAHATMPYAVLMEIALQPCGLMGAYLGSTLAFADKNLYFRNLDGDGEFFDLPYGTDFRGNTISNKSVLTTSVALGGTVIQNYTFELSVDGVVFYKGKSSFGFFPADALASQVGLDKGAEVPAWYVTEQLSPSDYTQINLDSLYGKMKLYKAPQNKPHYRLSGDQLNLLDKLIIVKDGGQFGKGYIHATKFIKTYDWYFTCHFYQDPVMPGSLGVEAILQAVQVYALQQDLGKDFTNPKFVQLPNHKTVWKYRGQILLNVKEMHLEVHIKSVEKRGDILAIIADAYLWNEKMRIYQVTDLALGIQ